MKKIFFPLAITLFSGVVIFAGCETSAQKVENAQQNVTDAQIKLDQARTDSVAQYEKEKAVWASQISANDKALADFRTQIAKEKKEKRDKDEAKLDILEKRNADMKIKMDEYKEGSSDNWEDFKAGFKKVADEYNDDMTAFGKSLGNLIDNN